ncbi:MAG: glycosyltransferase family 39 protein [Halorhodospira sp.]
MAGRTSWRGWGPLAVVLGLAAGLPALLPADRWFWYDEMYQATYATQSMLDAILATLRFDLHPPLHSLQMVVWGWIHDSDTWLRLNSVFWGTLTVALVYFCGRRRIGEREALVAALLLALLPAAVAANQTLRMYPMLAALAVLTWHFSAAWLSEQASHRALWGLGAAGLAATYTHATGIFIPVTAGFLGIVLIAAQRPDWPRIRAWGLTQLAIALLAAPAMANSLVRSVGHTAVPELTDIWTGLADLVMSTIGVREGLGATLAFAIWALALAAVIPMRARSLVVGYVVFPIVLVLALSYGVRPVWHPRALFYILPFIALGAGTTLVSLADRLGAVVSNRARMLKGALIGGVSAVLAIAVVLNNQIRSKGYDYPSAVTWMQEHAEPGDMVVAPHHANFWGVNRYWIGPRWGSVMEVQGWPGSERWQQLYERLGETWRKRLRLEGRTRSVTTNNGQEIWIGYREHSRFAEADRIWVVASSADQLEWLPELGFEEERYQEFRGLPVRLYTRD